MRVESRPNVISRRRFITGGLAFRALTFIGCQEGSTYLPHTQPDISSNNTTEIAPDYKVLIKNYYPELALLSPPVTYNLNTDIPTSVHNFTNLSFKAVTFTNQELAA